MSSVGSCVQCLLYPTLIIYCPENCIIIFIKKHFPSNRIPILVVLVAIPNIYGMNIFMDRIHNMTKSSAIPSKQTCIKCSKHKHVRLLEQELLSLNSTPFCSGFVLLNL